MKKFLVLLVIIFVPITFVHAQEQEEDIVTLKGEPEEFNLIGEDIGNIPSGETFFDLRDIPDNATVTFAELTYNQSGISDGLVQLIDKLDLSIADSKALNTEGTRTSKRIITLVQGWISKPEDNFGLLFQTSGMSGTADIIIADISLSLTYEIPDNKKPKILKVRVENTTSTTALISWDTNEVTKGVVEYGKTSNYDQQTTISKRYKLTNSVLLTDLNPGVSYHFRLEVTDKSGNTQNYLDQTFITSIDRKDILGQSEIIVDPSVLGSPERFNVELINTDTDFKIELAWSDSKTSQYDGYIIYRSTDIKDNYDEYYRIPSSQTRYSDESIESEHTYHYFVRTYRENVISQKSPEQSIFVPQPKRANNFLKTVDNSNDDLVQKVMILSALLGSIIFSIYLFLKVIKKVTKNNVNGSAKKGFKNVLKDPEYYTADFESTFMRDDSPN